MSNFHAAAAALGIEMVSNATYKEAETRMNESLFIPIQKPGALSPKLREFWENYTV